MGAASRCPSLRPAESRIAYALGIPSRLGLVAPYDTPEHQVCESQGHDERSCCPCRRRWRRGRQSGRRWSGQVTQFSAPKGCCDRWVDVEPDGKWQAFGNGLNRAEETDASGDAAGHRPGRAA